MQLRDYQSDGINKIRKTFSSGVRRVAYIAPCGAGKGTMVAYMANKAADNGKNVLFIIHRQELLQQIADDIGRKHELIQLASVQTIVRQLDKIPVPDLIISDEFHHGTANTWRKIFNYFKNAYLVGLTATPARTDGSGLGEICDELIIGPSVKWLISKGFLAPYRYFAPPMPVDFSDIKIKLGDYDQKEIAVRMDKPHITGQAIEHYKQLAEGKQAIVYCASIQHSINTVDSFISYGYNAKHVDGKTPDEERKQAIADFKSGKLRIMSNVDLFGEGLNLPGVEVVILLRPTQSLVLHVQQSMRSMRPGEGKTAIIIDAVGNVFRHGLPDEERSWSLESKKRSKKEKDPSVGIKSCPECYAAHDPAPQCPECKFIYPVKSRNLEESDGDLKEITAIEKRERRMDVGKCKTIDELKAIAADRGYKSSWVHIQAKMKNIRE